MTAEQQARDLLDRMGIEGAQQMTAGDVAELANLIEERERLRSAAAQELAAERERCAAEVDPDWSRPAGGCCSVAAYDELKRAAARIRALAEAKPVTRRGSALHGQAPRADPRATAQRTPQPAPRSA